MATAIQRRRGSELDHAGFTGLAGEITIDTTNNTVVVHDGVTAGGFRLAKYSEVVSAAQGDISSVSAGSGLTGGAATGDATLSLDYGNLAGSLIPTADVTYDLGSPTKRWRDLYLSGNTIDLGGSTLSYDGSSLIFNGAVVAVAGDSNFTTADLTEDTGNLFFTDARARAAISVSGSLAYNSSTGVISFTERTDQQVRNLILAGTGITYDNLTGTISLTDTGYITQVNAGNGLTGGGTEGIVTLDIGAGTGINVLADSISVNMGAFDTDDLVEGVTNQYFTTARARASISAGNGATYDSGTGVIALDYENLTGNLIPSANVTYTLGSLTNQWKDLYIGPGSLYLNGTKILEDNSGTITMNADPGQNLSFNVSGGGTIDLNASTATIQLKSDVQILSGKTITTSGGAATQFGGAIDMNSNKITELGAPTVATDAATKGYVDTLVSSGSISGDKTFTNNVTVQGNLTISGTTTTVNSETIALADNIIDLNSNFTTGAPTENAGLRVLRGDEPAVQIRWNEASDHWETFNGTTTTKLPLNTGDLQEDPSALYFTDGRATANFNTNFAASTTSGLAEGANLYYTAARANAAIDARVTKGFVDALSVNAGTLGGQAPAYYLAWSNFTGVPSPTLSLSGDVTGSVVMTNLESATIVATVADNSHNHTISNVTGLQAALDAKVTTGSAAYISSATALDDTITFTRGDGTTFAVTTADANTNYYLTGSSFNTTDGVLTFTRAGLADLTVDLDGRYSLEHSHPYDNYGGWTLLTDGTSRGTISSGEGVNFVGGAGVTLSYSATNNAITIASPQRAITDTPTGDSNTSISALWAQSALTNATVANDTITFTRGDGTTFAVTTSDANTNYYVTGGSFDTATGVISITGNNAAVTASIDIDGRYSELGHTHTVASLSDWPAAVSTVEVGYLDGVTSNIQTQLNGKAASSHTHAYDNYGSWTLYTDGTSRGAITSGEIVNLVGGTNCSLAYNATNNTITINSTDTNTTYAAGNGLTLTGTTFAVGAGSYITTSATTVSVNATSANTASTVVARDASGNFSAGVITATATTARYADLAEKYATDAQYEAGTVVVFGGECEVTACLADAHHAVAGVISTDPAYMMNSEAQGQYVALTGRVPCKVTGVVNKGDLLVTSTVPGHAKADNNAKAGRIIGKAIGSSAGGDAVIEVLVNMM